MRTKEKYLEFIEYKYGIDLHHKFLEDKLKYFNSNDEEEINTQKIKEINEKLIANTIMKKVFKKIKFDGNNKEEILSLIDSNREEITLETFRNKKDMYANYCNTNQLFNDSQNYCRLVGYYIDAGKKGKSIGYAFNSSSFVGQDIKEFDFIPFAFVNDRESLFINDNYEIILKNRDKDYFETLYIRKQSIDILQAIDKQKIDYNSLCFKYKITEDYYIDVYQKVIDCILNNTLLDELIDLLLKQNNNKYKVYQLLKINNLIRGENIMDTNVVKRIHACANEVRRKIPGNKLESYKQKLISSIVFKDYDRVCQILLQLSAYSDTYFSFADELFIDFEKNKDIAYMFINALGKDYESDKGNNTKNKLDENVNN